MSATLAAAVAMHSEMGDPVANLDRIEEWVDKAHEAGATFAVFPEECITGSLNKTDLPGDEIERIVTDAVRLSRPRLESLAARYRMTLVVGTIDKRGEKYGNAALIVGPDGYIATFYKLWLPNENESEFFEVGDERKKKRKSTKRAAQLAGGEADALPLSQDPAVIVAFA